MKKKVKALISPNLKQKADERKAKQKAYMATFKKKRELGIPKKEWSSSSSAREIKSGTGIPNSKRR